MRGGTRLPGSGSARSARPRTFASQGSLAPKPLRERVGRRGFLAIHDAASKRFRLSVCARAPDRALAAIPLVSPVPRSRRLSDVCFAPVPPCCLADSPLPFPVGKRADRMTHKREGRPLPPPPPRTHLDALSCSHARDFWPPNRVLARNPPHLKGKKCSRTKKAQIGRIGAGQSTPKERRSVPERGLVARNRRFPCTRDNRQSAPPSPSGKLDAPANPTSALSRPFRHLPAATRKGRSVRRGLPSSPFASRRGAAQRKAGDARQEALRRLRLAPGTAAVALLLRLELQCGRGFATDDARLRHRTRKASSRALRSANTAPISSVPRHATAHAFHARTRPIGTLRGTAAAPVPSASAPPASLWP